MQVMKFGGSSIKNAERIKAVTEIIKQKTQTDPDCIVVVSALGDGTDSLSNLAEIAKNGDDYTNEINDLKTYHLNCVKELSIKDENLSSYIEEIFSQLNEKLNGIRLLKEITEKAKDYVLSCGEKLSANIISAACQQNGLAVKFIDTCDLIVTDNNYGSANVIKDVTSSNIQEAFPTSCGLNLVTGFIAKSTEGETTTLGRGGSDYTAALIGSIVETKIIEIWTDVDGIFTADPNKVQKAFPQHHVSFAEAMELSHFGANVIYPPAIQPALNKGIPIIVKNSFNPSAAGTIVGKDAADNRSSICGITSIDEVAFLRLEGSGMVGKPGSARRLFTALAYEKINVLLITQASSEYTICFAIAPEDIDKAKKAIESEFALEIKSKIIEPIIIQENACVISVIGENMRTTPGVSGKTFTALGKNGINIIAIAQGSSEFNISAVISKKDQTKALKSLHEEFFFPDTKTINVCVIGLGLIGKELINQIKTHADNLEKDHGHAIRLLGLANTKKMLFNPEGIPVENLSLDLLEQGSKSDLDLLIQKLNETSLPNILFVDCTASEEVANKYHDILRSNISIVTPNKKAQSADIEYYRKLKHAATKRGIEFLYETSVGAGLPVISSLNDLLKSGDQITKIEGVLSGTLSYIFNSFQPGMSFAEIVIKAKEAGYTEPDPRDDLNGLDVARKILILARECGYELELEDVEVENLVPKNCRKTDSIEECLDLLKNSDDFFNDKVNQAKKVNGKLCYLAKLDEGKASVALEIVGPEHPFYNLSGSDNIISFTSSRYKECPLVVKGPGAGASVTAAGVFADIIRLSTH